METRPYASYDLYWLDTHTPPGWFSTTSLRQLVDPSLSVSFEHDGQYLGSSGLFQLWEGVYEAWLVLLVQPPSGWSLLGHLTRALALGEKLTKAHRLQAYCVAEFYPGRVLARRLGFQEEGVLKCATPTKGDLVVFGKVR